jgi:hypothetical protein
VGTGRDPDTSQQRYEKKRDWLTAAAVLEAFRPNGQTDHPYVAAREARARPTCAPLQWQIARTGTGRGRGRGRGFVYVYSRE